MDPKKSFPSLPMFAQIVVANVYPDGSGANAVVSIGGFWMCFDCLGRGAEMFKCEQNPLTDDGYYYVPRARQIAMARATYEHEVLNRQSKQWFEKNVAMYADNDYSTGTT